MRLGLAAAFVLVTAGGAQVPLVEKTALTLDGAKKIAAVAEAKAEAEGARVVIAVVDEGGSLLLLERLDDTSGQRQRRYRQSTDRSDLLPAQQSVRGSGEKWTRIRVGSARRRGFAGQCTHQDELSDGDRIR